MLATRLSERPTTGARSRTRPLLGLASLKKKSQLRPIHVVEQGIRDFRDLGQRPVDEDAWADERTIALRTGFSVFGAVLGLRTAGAAWSCRTSADGQTGRTEGQRAAGARLLQKLPAG